MIVQLCPFVKLFAYGEGFTTTINLKCMVLHVDHWLVDIWLKQGRERQWSSPRMGEAQKTQSKNRQQYKKHRLQWTVFIIFVSQFHFSSLYVRTLTFSTAGCQASNSTSKSGPQTSCTTYFVHCLHRASSAGPEILVKAWFRLLLWIFVEPTKWPMSLPAFMLVRGALCVTLWSCPSILYTVPADRNSLLGLHSLLWSFPPESFKFFLSFVHSLTSIQTVSAMFLQDVADL